MFTAKPLDNWQHGFRPVLSTPGQTTLAPWEMSFRYNDRTYSVSIPSIAAAYETVVKVEVHVEGDMLPCYLPKDYEEYKVECESHGDEPKEVHIIREPGVIKRIEACLEIWQALQRLVTL